MAAVAAIKVPPEPPMDPTAQLMHDLRQAAHALDVGDSGLNEYRRLAARALKDRFTCSMASLWRFHGRPGERSLRCVAALSDDSEINAAGIVLAEDEAGAYFAALARDGLFNCADVLADPRLAGLMAAYLLPQRVRGLLDTSFQINGQLIGVLCIEQRDTPRLWTRAEEIDLRKAASAISLALSRQLAGADRPVG
jgi:GAF domain-containing protein